MTKFSLVSTIFWDWTDFKIKFGLFFPLYDVTWPELTQNLIFWNILVKNFNASIILCTLWNVWNLTSRAPNFENLTSRAPNFENWPQIFFLNYSPKFDKKPQFDFDLNSFNDFWALTSFIGLFWRLNDVTWPQMTHFWIFWNHEVISFNLSTILGILWGFWNLTPQTPQIFEKWPQKIFFSNEKK